MILLIVNAIGITILEFERDAPWPVHVNRVANRPAVQTMKIEAKQVHFVGTHCHVELAETSQDAIVHPCIDLRRFAARPQIAERLVFERPDHKAALLPNPT